MCDFVRWILLDIFVTIALLLPTGISQTCTPGTGEILIRSSSDAELALSPIELTTLGEDITVKKQGSFYSPSWPQSYQSGTRCVFRFIANVGEKVRIQFDRFHLVGEMPTCPSDFLDIYVDVASSSLDLDRQAALLRRASSGEPQTTTPFSAAIYSAVLDKSDLIGRYCGQYLNSNPIEFISLHREIVLDFYTEHETSEVTWRRAIRQIFGFNGTFEFISDTDHYPGKALPASELPIPSAIAEDVYPSCRFRIEPQHTQLRQHNSLDLEGVSGEIISPTYPGYHPDGLVCVYQLVGLSNQRINVDILDLSLHSGLGGCPSDYLQFYDGLRLDDSHKPAQLIGQPFCDDQTNLRIVSTGSAMLIVLVTGSTNLWTKKQSGNQTFHNPVRRGFRLRYTFSRQLMPIAQLPGTEHIRGTECDYLVRNEDRMEQRLEWPMSDTDSILAPNRVCNFIFAGTRHDRFIETVSVGFEFVELPKARTSVCDNGRIGIYGMRRFDGSTSMIKPQWESFEDVLKPNAQPDHVFCGRNSDIGQLMLKNNSDRYPIVARHTLLVIRFNSSGTEQPGMSMRFVLVYRFKKDFGIPGQRINSDSCQFLYSHPTLQVASISSQGSAYSTSPNNQSYEKGWTNSPLYPSNYPTNSVCLYLFAPMQSETYQERIRLTFQHFNTIVPGDWITNIVSKRTDRMMSSEYSGGVCHQDFLEIIELYIPIKYEVITTLAFLATYPAFTAEFSIENWVQQWHDIEKQLQMRLGTKQNILEPAHIYCGDRTPGPLVSDNSATGILMRFQSGSNHTAKGFAMTYEFLTNQLLHVTSSEKSMSTACSIGNPANLPKSNSNNTLIYESGGHITSPNYPQSYNSNFHCEWILRTAIPTSKIQLHFETFVLEGSEKDCSRSILRIYDGNSPRSAYELCGTHVNMVPLVLTSSLVRIKMDTSNDAQGAQGFKLIWTELLQPVDGKECEGFQCKHTGHCILKRLECDELPNCGAYEKDGKLLVDSSDETVNCAGSINYNLAHIGVGVLLTLILLVVIAAFIYYRERKRRQKMPLDPLSELTGSKHSVAYSTHQQFGSKSNHQHQHHQPYCRKQQKNMGHGHTHAHCNSHPDLTSSLPVDNQLSYTSGTLRSQHHHHHHHHHHHANKLLDQGHTHNTMRDCVNTHCAPTSDTLHNHPYNTGRLHRKSNKPPSHTGSLSRNGAGVGGNVTGSINSGMVGSGTGLSVGMDGGLLIREQMQKISIV